MRAQLSLFLAGTALAAPQPQLFGGVSIGLGTIPLGLVQLNRVHPVVVGGPQDTFVPNTVMAAPGDTIQFQFSSGNHTVTQSSPQLACQPLQASVPGAVHSGHIPFEEGQTTVGVFNMQVQSTATMYLYCATGPHCLEGQVMVVNPTSQNDLTEYAKLALGAEANIDGTVVAGGTVDEIPLEQAAFVVPPAEEEEGGGEEEAPAETEAGETAVETEAPAETDAGETAVETEAPAETEVAETPAEGEEAVETPAEGEEAAETPAEGEEAAETPAEGEEAAEGEAEAAA